PGDATELPPKPDFPTSWSIGTPDAVVEMSEDFTVPASGTIEYQYFEVPTNFTEDKWIQALEILPGAREVVHHVLVFARAPAPPPSMPATAPAPRPAGMPAPAPLFIRPAKYNTLPDAPRQDARHAPPPNRGVLIGTEVP